MPVFNEEKYIADAINSILIQSFQNFELIISDNASTDGTQGICRKYASKDNRIRYYRNEQNIGASNNFNLVFTLSRGEYFVWVSGHDKRQKDFLSESIEKLSTNKDTVLCYSDAYWLDDHGNIIGLIHYSFNSEDSNRRKRFKNVLLGVLQYASPIYGVYRTEALKKTGLFKKLFAGDVLLLCELSLIGPFVYIEKPMLEVRQLPDFGDWAVYLEKLYCKKLTKSKAFKEYYNTIMHFFSLIDNNFTERRARLYLKVVTVYFFLIGQRYVLYKFLFKI